MERWDPGAASIAVLLAKAAEYRDMAKTALTVRTREAFLRLAAEYEALAMKRGSP
jgi:hypothetical protein